MTTVKRMFTVCCVCISACHASQNITSVSNNVRVVEEKITSAKDALVFTEGIPAYTAGTFNYKRKDQSSLNIQFNDPTVVGVASQPEKWGYFQFPKIQRKADGVIQAKWNMKADALEAYGMDNAGYANSTDGGKTWNLQERGQTSGEVLLPNGDRVEIVTPKPIKSEDLKLPKPVGTGLENYRKSDFTFYRLHDLPPGRQGVFLRRLNKGETEWKVEQATLYDPDAARYTLAGLMPVVWWGDIHVAKDNSLIAGIYPGYLIGKDGVTDPKSGVFFYRSTDNGHSWHIQGRIPYHPNVIADTSGTRRHGFTEPGFEILKDGTFLCVVRTTDGVGNGPMYASYSKDLGKTWTIPKPITAAGVLPRLLQLKNGVVVLAAGRPGVQLRFSVNGDNWTEPFEMMPYESEKETVSCGYTGLLATGANSFLLIYSDFKHKTEDGLRKAIKVREVIVKRK